MSDYTGIGMPTLDDPHGVPLDLAQINSPPPEAHPRKQSLPTSCMILLCGRTV
ncbi:MAG: hypothetical protein ABJZ55_09300 [Fuerstiella sp.]